jgi:hypothetical protein
MSRKKGKSPPGGSQRSLYKLGFSLWKCGNLLCPGTAGLEAGWSGEERVPRMLPMLLADDNAGWFR